MSYSLSYIWRFYGIFCFLCTHLFFQLVLFYFLEYICSPFLNIRILIINSFCNHYEGLRPEVSYYNRYFIFHHRIRVRICYKQIWNNSNTLFCDAFRTTLLNQSEAFYSFYALRIVYSFKFFCNYPANMPVLYFFYPFYEHQCALFTAEYTQRFNGFFPGEPVLVLIGHNFIKMGNGPFIPQFPESLGYPSMKTVTECIRG